MHTSDTSGTTGCATGGPGRDGTGPRGRTGTGPGRPGGRPGRGSGPDHLNRRAQPSFRVRRVSSPSRCEVMR
ncbi:hypothetical protein F8144_25510 [Streptomyces triticiradicis]|uniref:Uncharacterized protein n=1 Tax=Streptomyces triticiradicis TaxID=2651189 RepID=A0A7J5DAU2_9ACTN|nr:hypothetical protein F8144_25510 [Streptomyces triticiradicis]